MTFFLSRPILRYEGNFSEDQPNGDGTLYHSNGQKRCTRNFKNGQIDGQDVCIWYDTGVLKYEGSMKMGVCSGVGTWYFENGNMKFKGNFLNDLPHGSDVKIYMGEGNLEYQGGMKAGKREGKGVLYYPSENTKCYEGGFSQDEFSNYCLTVDEIYLAFFIVEEKWSIG